MATLPQVAPATLAPATLTPATLTLEEYLHTSYRPDVDFVDDHIEERNLGEKDHSRLQALIASWFIPHETEWNILTYTEYRTRTAETRVRIPDLSVTRLDGAKEKVRTTPALLCIEILSPEDRLSRVKPRLTEFLDMGVPNVWLLDPARRAAYTHTRQGLQLVDADRLTIPNSPIYLDLAKVFSALD